MRIKKEKNNKEKDKIETTELIKSSSFKEIPENTILEDIRRGQRRERSLTDKGVSREKVKDETKYGRSSPLNMRDDNRPKDRGSKEFDKRERRKSAKITPGGNTESPKKKKD